MMPADAKLSKSVWQGKHIDVAERGRDTHESLVLFVTQEKPQDCGSYRVSPEGMRGLAELLRELCEELVHARSVIPCPDCRGGTSPKWCPKCANYPRVEGLTCLDCGTKQVPCPTCEGLGKVVLTGGPDCLCKRDTGITGSGHQAGWIRNPNGTWMWCPVCSPVPKRIRELHAKMAAEEGGVLSGAALDGT